MPRRLPRKVCPRPECIVRGKTNTGHIRFHGHFRLEQGQRRRYICDVCGRSFCSTTGTPYHRRRSSRKTFDEVCHLSVEGVSIAVIGRLKNKAWDTIHGWLESARDACARFNTQNLHVYEIKEPQADELKTFIDGPADRL